LSWMAWTWPTALFFAAMALALVVMTVAELKWPGRERRGFLPLVTSRGDRFFISLLVAAFLHLAWLSATALPVAAASVIAILIGVVVMRWG